MKLIVTEKNDAANQIARLMSTSGAPKKDTVYSTPVYRFTHNGEECAAIGLRGHILKPDFPPQLFFSDKNGWYALNEEGEVMPSDMPDGLARPPYDTKRKPFLADGVDIKGWKLPSLPYLIWAPIEKLPAEKQIIRALKNLAKKADSIVIGTDFDREGELIGSDALHQMRMVAPDTPVSRARYSAFTKEEINHAFDNLVELDQDLADAGESRQFIDLVWGAVLTRYLTLARFGGFGNVRSAGRVQTPTLALVVEKEREREAFIPEDYWVLQGECVKDGETFKVSHETARLKDLETAQAAYEIASKADFARLVDVTKKARKQNPPTPFNTTSLQTAASSIGLSPARTMRIAETLYMDGLISYPRVDNTVYPKSLDLKANVKMLSKNPAYAEVCQKLLAQPSLSATHGKKETTDHPPIYPTAVANPDKLDPAAWKLYNLIARRFLATLMGPATLENTKLAFDVDGEPFAASGSVLVEPGYREIYPYGLKKDDIIPQVEIGEEVPLQSVELLAKQTDPPARYSQAKLIQEMEKRGLGTKSTRASIIERLYNVKYIKNDPIVPSKLGMAVIEALKEYAAPITSPEMTSNLEQDMNEVAEGKNTQTHVVDHSRALLASMIDGLIEHKEDLSEAIADAVTADAKVGNCPKCGKDLVVKNSPKTRSSFVGCMGWPECDVTYPLPKDKIDALEDENGNFVVCEVCGAPKVKVSPWRSKPYEICINPRCETNREPDLVVGICQTCAKEGKSAKLIAHKSETTGRRFVRCENFDVCETSYPLPQRGKLSATGETCPDCGAPIVEIETARGPWRTCINMNCPAKEKKKESTKKKSTTKKATAKRTTTKKKTTKKASTKKTTAKKTTKKAVVSE